MKSSNPMKSACRAQTHQQGACWGRSRAERRGNLLPVAGTLLPGQLGIRRRPEEGIRQPGVGIRRPGVGILLRGDTLLAEADSILPGAESHRVGEGIQPGPADMGRSRVGSFHLQGDIRDNSSLTPGDNKTLRSVTCKYRMRFSNVVTVLYICYIYNVIP